MNPLKTVPGLILAAAMGLTGCAEATSVPLSARPATSSAAPATLGGMNVPNPVSDATFDAEVKANPLPVVVFAYAEWAGPSRVAAPSLMTLSQDPEYSGRVVIRSLNVDYNPNTTKALGIASIPIVLFMRNGKIVDVTIGALPMTALKAFINRNLP